MIHISDPLGAAGLEKYHKQEFSHKAGAAYYGEGQQVSGTWHGKLASELGLTGPVSQEHFSRLARGLDPNDPDRVLVKPGLAKNDKGEWEEARRAGNDITIGTSHKSISNMNAHALAHGDNRVQAAHEAAVKDTLDYLQDYVTARGGGSNPDIHTGKWIVATFTHDTARPVDGYAAPHLHTHAVLFNVTQDENGQWRSIQTKPIFDSQAVANAVYNNRISYHLRQQGFEVEFDRVATHLNAKIAGYSQEFLDRTSPRTNAIEQEAERQGVSSFRERERIAHEYRDPKLDVPREQIVAMQQSVEAEFGNQSAALYDAAQLRRGQRIEADRAISAEEVVTTAKKTLEQRVAVFDERMLEQKALQQSQGYVSFQDIRENIRSRAAETEELKAEGRNPEFIQVYHTKDYDLDRPERYYTTRDLKRDESETMLYMLDGKGKMPAIAQGSTAEQIQQRYAQMNDGLGISKEQAIAVAERVNGVDRMSGIVGGAGVGKTASVLRPIQDIAQENGYEVIGLAPTAKATKELKKYDIANVMTLQKAMAGRGALLEKMGVDPSKPRVYFVDEASLKATGQYRDTMEWVTQRPQDRVIYIGDPRQHQSIEPSRAYEMLLQAGMDHSAVDSLRRPKTEQLQQVGKFLQTGSIDGALRYLDNKDRWEDKTSRVFQAREDLSRQQFIAQRYVMSPENTLVVSPDNKSREELNALIRSELQKTGQLKADKMDQVIYKAEQNVTSPEKKLSASYQTGMVLQFSGKQEITTSTGQKVAIGSGEYATVLDTNPDLKNQKVTIRLHRDSSNPDLDVISYDPRKGKASKVEMYEPQLRQLAEGDRILFRKNDKEHQIANGDVGIIKSIMPNKSMLLEIQGEHTNRRVFLSQDQMRHTDHGYVTTSYSSQGMTIRNVIVNIDTGNPSAMQLLKKELGYVAISRATHDVRIVTDDLPRAIKLLSRESENHTAHSFEEKIGFAKLAEGAREQLKREKAIAKVEEKREQPVYEIQQPQRQQRIGGGFGR